MQACNKTHPLRNSCTGQFYCWHFYELLFSQQTISTASAINKGIRSTRVADLTETRGRRRHVSPKSHLQHGRSFPKGASAGKQNEIQQKASSVRSTLRRKEPIVSEAPFRAPSVNRRHGGSQSSGSTDVGSKQSSTAKSSTVPIPVHYTTAASQFIYGANVVVAALKANRRKFYRMYLNRTLLANDSERDANAATSSSVQALISLAKAARVPLTDHADTRILDKVSEGRRHNGVVLEASKLPVPPVLQLGKSPRQASVIPVKTALQSREDLAINGNPDYLTVGDSRRRWPFVVLLDGITDPGNVGNILRTCHFYGVDVVAIATNTCANLSSPVLAKASSGACEAVQLIGLPKPSNFVYESAKAGWKVYAAVAPTEAMSGSGEVSKLSTAAEIAKASPLIQHPCILMLGAEGEGLRKNLVARADYFVTIERGTKGDDWVDVGVDSMNVGVAAGILLDSFLKMPKTSSERSGDLGW